MTPVVSGKSPCLATRIIIRCIRRRINSRVNDSEDSGQLFVWCDLRKDRFDPDTLSPLTCALNAHCSVKNVSWSIQVRRISVIRYLGFYGTGANAVVPSSGTVELDITLGVVD